MMLSGISICPPAFLTACRQATSPLVLRSTLENEGFSPFSKEQIVETGPQLSKIKCFEVGFQNCVLFLAAAKPGLEMP